MKLEARILTISRARGLSKKPGESCWTKGGTFTPKGGRLLFWRVTCGSFKVLSGSASPEKVCGPNLASQVAVASKLLPAARVTVLALKTSLPLLILQGTDSGPLVKFLIVIFTVTDSACRGVVGLTRKDVT